MLLVIHNLPKMMRYEEVKDFIKDRCNLTNIIVDNLMLETTLTQKVTIGLSDDTDAAIVFKELNGLLLSGRKIVVEGLRKKKDSGMRFQSPMNQDNVMTTDIASKYAAYDQSLVGNYCLPNMGTAQNTQMQYPPAPCPPVFGNTQQQDTSPDFIPFSGDKSKSDFYGEVQSDRYFNWKDDNYNAPDMRGGPSYSKDENTSNVWSRNRSDDYKGHFDSGDAKVGAGRDFYQWSRGNERDDHTRGGERSRNFENDFEPQYDSRPFRNDPKCDGRSARNDPKYDGRLGRNDPKYDGRPVRNTPKYNRAHERSKSDRFQKPNPRSDYGPRFPEQSGGRQKEHAASARDYQNRPEHKPTSVNAYKNSSNEARGQPHISRRGYLVYNQPNNGQKTPDNAEVLKNKDETWRGQAVSAIVKDLLMENGMQHLVQKQYFLSYVKPMVKSKIDAMLGNRKAVPLPQIIEEYKQKNNAVTQRAFIIDVRKKYEKTRVESGETSKEEYEETVRQLDSRNLKRPATGPPMASLGNASKKQKTKPNKPKYETKTFQRPKTPPPKDALPKYPNNDKIAYKKLKRLEKDQPDVYDHRLDAELKKALDKEINLICDLFRNECQKVDDKDEKEICSRILKMVEAFKTKMHSNVSKRLLNITENLPLRVYTEERVNSKEIKEKFKSLGIATFRKTLGKNMYVATCHTFEQYDYLCAQEIFIIDGQKIWFRPLHMGRPQRKPRKNKANANQNEMSPEKGEANDDNVEEIKDEEGGDEEFDFCEEDDGMGEDWFENDEQKDEKKDVKIIKSEDGNNIKLTKTEAVAKEKVEISDENIKSEFTESSYPKIESAESTALDTQEQKPEQPSNEMKNVETVKLIQDIQALSSSINNEENTNDLEQNKAGTNEQNITNICISDQYINEEDLEDF